MKVKTLSLQDLLIKKVRSRSFRHTLKMTKMSDKQEGNSKVIEIKVEHVNPKPCIGLLGAVAFGMGSMIGSGIFISPKGALQNAGSVGMSLVMWSLRGVMSLFMGLVYGELGSLIPHSGGDFTYTRKGLGSLPAFLAVWIIPIFSHTASMAVLSLVFADYLLALLFGSCSPACVIRQLIATLVIFTLCITNVVSVRIGAYTQIICTVAKTLALIIISGSGIVFIAKGSVENLNDAFKGSSTNVEGYAIAIYNCMFAYGGYVRIGEIAEELKNPTRNIPRAIFISVTAVTIIYVMTNISYFVLLPKFEFLKSSAVAYDWALKGIKPIAFLIPISVMLSVYGANNGNGFTTGRVLFSAARAGQLPDIFSNLHVTSSVPVVSIVGMHILSALLLISNDIGKLINFLNFILFVIVCLSTLSLLRRRYQQRRFERKDKNRFQTPLFVPVITCLICVFLIVSPLLSNPRVEFLYSLALVAIGVVLFVPFVYFELKIPGTGSITIFLQLLFNVCPTRKLD